MDISIIIPVYNVEEEYLRACLNSVLDQNVRNYEVIIADDGSTDNSGAIVDEYAAKHPEFKVLHLKNGGPGRARNIALSHAKGKYITFLDSDDLLAPGILEKMLLRAEHDKSDVTICNVSRFNSRNTWDSYNHRRVFRDLDSLTDVRKSPSLLYDTVSSNKLIRRSLWEKYDIRYPEDILYEDIPVMTEVYLRARRVSVIRTVGYMWRVRDGETSSTTQRRREFRNLQDRLTALRMLDRLFDETGADRDLCLEKQLKALKLDLKMYINLCSDQDREEAEQYAEAIRGYIRESISDEAIEALNPADQEIYRALIAKDIDRLKKLVAFRKERYPGIPLTEKDSRLLMKVDRALFNEDYIDVTMSARFRFPVLQIKTVKLTEDERIKIVAYMYFPMINMPDTNYQTVRAYLYDEYTGEETALKVEKRLNKWMEEEDCTVTDELTGETISYTYKGTAFNVYLDPVKILKPHKEAVILLRYENRFTSGTTLLKNTARLTEKEKESLSKGKAKKAIEKKEQKIADKIANASLTVDGISVVPEVGSDDVIRVRIEGHSLKQRMKGFFTR